MFNCYWPHYWLSLFNFKIGIFFKALPDFLLGKPKTCQNRPGTSLRYCSYSDHWSWVEPSHWNTGGWKTSLKGLSPYPTCRRVSATRYTTTTTVTATPGGRWTILRCCSPQTRRWGYPRARERTRGSAARCPGPARPPAKCTTGTNISSDFNLN